jgi:glycerol-3-phosphate dehydrogenase
MRARPQAFQRIAGNSFDLCVIGGGATGAGCALDAQLRGLKTALLDGGDFASAASSASTKLAHGGVRYLEQAVKRLNLEEYRMVQAALRERMHMLRNAPHLAHAAEFLVPVFSWTQAVYYQIGMRMYDWIAGKDTLFPSRFLRRDEALRRMPSLRADRLHGAVSYSDGQFDDSRYDLSLVQTFTEAGGEALNYARVTGFAKDAAGRLGAATARDQLSGKEFAIQARAFVNATGPASDAIRLMACPDTTCRLRPSKGVHILFPLDEFRSSDALLVPKTEDGRVIFAVPWLGRLLVGTTDDEATPDTKMIVLREEAEYLLRQLNPYLAKPLRVEQVVSGLSGLRPLVAARGQKGTGRRSTQGTKELIRDHEVEVDERSGLISILGGKWTTHRLMAEDTIDAVQKSLGGAIRTSMTKEHALVGAEGFTADYWKKLTAEYALAEATAQHLAQKFGTRAPQVLALVRAEASLAEPLVAGLPYLSAEVSYAIQNEMAQTIEDILARRLGLQLFDWRKAIEAAPVVGDMLARGLGWTREKRDQEVATYTEKIRGFLSALGLAENEGLATPTRSEPRPPQKARG